MTKQNDSTLLQDNSEPSLEGSQGASSPHWSKATKIIVSVLLLLVGAALLFYFNNYFKLLVIALVITYLLYPICTFLHTKLKLSWGLSTALVYLLLVGGMVSLLASGGTTLVTQVVNLYNTVVSNLGKISNFISSWSEFQIVVGPLSVTTPKLDTSLINELVTKYLQPMLGKMGPLVSNLAKGAGSMFFNLLITYMVSFFLTSESKGVKKSLVDIKIPGYEEDLARMGQEISKIFSSFVRGTFTVVLISIVIYSVFLGSLGLPYFFMLALIAGFGRFIPYVGAWAGWIGFIVGALMQDPTPFGLSKILYAGIILIVALVIDTIFDHILTPKVMSESLEVHPAAVLLSALIFSKLFGILGVMLAAPIFATLKLLLRYVMKKIYDEDPWEDMPYYKKPNESGLMKLMRVVWEFLAKHLRKPWQAVHGFFRRLFSSVLGLFRKKAKPCKTDKESSNSNEK